MKPPKQFFRPASLERRTAHERFRDMVDFVTSRHGFVTSPPGDLEMRIECPPGSILPDELRRAGYDVEPDGEGERILAASIVQRFGLDAKGEFEPLMTESSTRPVASTVTHAGICRVDRYTFTIGDDERD